jgi:peptide/nickel transport system ATP-binding protein
MQLVDEILGRPLRLHRGMWGDERRRGVAELLDMVELPRAYARRYPHELSGGQKQRLNLARALAAEPEVVICEEITSSLDKIAGAKIIELLKKMRVDTGVSFVFISHDLSTVAAFADEIVVLYAGRVVESGPMRYVLAPPYHPYTRLLIASVAELRVGWLDETVLKRGDVVKVDRRTSTVELGCPFFGRCPLALPGTCDSEFPPTQASAPGHTIACHRSLPELGGEGGSPSDRLASAERLFDC